MLALEEKYSRKLLIFVKGFFSDVHSVVFHHSLSNIILNFLEDDYRNTV